MNKKLARKIAEYLLENIFKDIISDEELEDPRTLEYIENSILETTEKNPNIPNTYNIAIKFPQNSRYSRIYKFILIDSHNLSKTLMDILDEMIYNEIIEDLQKTKYYNIYETYIDLDTLVFNLIKTFLFDPQGNKYFKDFFGIELYSIIVDNRYVYLLKQ